MDKPKATPKDFFLWAGAMISLWAGVIAFISLIFDYINFSFPNVLSYTPNPYQGGMPYEMASLIVLGPLFLILMRAIRRDIARDPTRNEVWVRRWALFLTIFAAGATITVDLIVLIMRFLSGEELSVAFLLKVVVVLLVASAGFMHFMADIWGFWKTYPERARYINYAVALLVVLTIAAGFFIVGTPQQARQLRLDDQRISDLQSIQQQVVYYYQQKQKLPTSVMDLDDPLSYYTLPKDPATGEDYGYRPDQVVAGMSPTFSVCATFATASASLGSAYSRPVNLYTGDTNWQHSIGQTCFERTIDPQLYPPTNPKAL